MKKSIILIILITVFIPFHLFGKIWSPLMRLTWNLGASREPSIAADSGNGIHIVWYDNTPVQNEIFYKHSPDKGTTWSATKRMTWSTNWTYNPCIAIDSANRIHVTWFDVFFGKFEIFYKRSLDGGSTWSAAKRMTWNSGVSDYPSITTDSGNGIHIVWRDTTPGKYEIFYKRSTDSGVTWSGQPRLTWSVGLSMTPSIAADSGNGIHVVWRGDAPGSPEIFYKRSTDSGTTWSGPTRLTWNTGMSQSPSIATDSGSGVFIIWEDSTPGNDEIFFKRSTNGGTTWSGPTRLTWNAGSSERPSIAADSGTGIHALWHDNTPGNEEIFYKQSFDSGTTWSGPTRLTWNTGVSRYPSVTADSGNGIHILWDDNTPGNYEIFYKNYK